MLSSPAADSRSGTLPGRAVPQTRRTGRLTATGTRAACRTLARQLRSDLGSADAKAGQAEWYEADDWPTETRSGAWPRQIAKCHRDGSCHKLYRCRCGATSTPCGRVESCLLRVDGCWILGPLSTSASDDE